MPALSVLLQAFLMAFVPTLLYATFLWWLDRYEKEPIPMLLVAFLWGAVPAILVALALELLADVPLSALLQAEARRFAEAGLLAPAVEEGVKAIILFALFIFSWREFDNALDGIIYGALVGLGFALVENVLYLVSAAYDGVPAGGSPDIGKMGQLWLLRAGLFGLNHSVFTAFTGAALGYARSLKPTWQRVAVPFLGLAAAMLLHAVHNNLVTFAGLLSEGGRDSGLLLGACFGVLVSDWGGLLLILIVAVASSVREGHVIRDTLWEEVSLGRFTPDEYATLSSGRRRWNARWASLSASGFRRWRQIGRFFDLATELAFRKHRMYDGTPQRQAICATDVARLRGEIDMLKSVMVREM
jgi:RsiW-degrading membrane proteinase PrsW (M82 family)